MKYYAGVPTSVVIVMDTDPKGAAPRPLEGGPFAWGKEPQPAVARAAINLAKALLRDALGHEGLLTIDRVYVRFMWRTVKVWKGDQPFRLGLDEVAKHLQDIDKVAAEMAGKMAQVALETGPRVTDGGVGVGGGRIALGQRDWERRG